ncbi:hypothetical protein EDD11_008217 [Mortierella claussenii]|nr:hypothetical protein EDD11_008217 [Mortierella claussenii]
MSGKEEMQDKESQLLKAYFTIVVGPSQEKYDDISVSRQSPAPGTQPRQHSSPGPSSRGKRPTPVVDYEEEEDEDVGEERDQAYQSEDDPNMMPNNDRIFQELEDYDRLNPLQDLDDPMEEQPIPLDTDGTSSDDSQDDGEDILPEVATIRLNFRRGDPNPPVGVKKDLRSIKNWPQKSFPFRISEGYNIFMARTNDYIDQIRAVKEYRGVRWWDGAQPYIRPTVSARQKDFSPILPDDLQPQLNRVLFSTMKYNKKNPGKEALPFTIDVFVYLKDTAGKQAQTVQRQSQSNIEEANRRINLAQQAGRFNIGPVEQTLYAREVASEYARQADLPVPPPPRTPLYDEARRLDTRLVEERQRRARSQASRDIAVVKLYNLGERDHWINMELDVMDIRRVLGFDLARIGEITRDPVPPPVMRPLEESASSIAAVRHQIDRCVKVNNAALESDIHNLMRTATEN